MRETKEIERLSARIYLLIILVIVALFQSIFKNVINERWASNRDTVACIPEIETHYPGVYLQSAAHPINEDAKIQNFIEQYVFLTKTAEIIEFHEVLPNVAGKQYDKARLSQSKFQAIFLADGPELELRNLEYAQSTDLYNVLLQKKMNLVFLIDSIEVKPVYYGMWIPVVVRGQYEGVFDQADAATHHLPPEFLGYREIRYLIKRTFESRDVNDNIENKTGLFVVSSQERILSAGEKRKLDNQSREFLLHRSDQ